MTLAELRLLGYSFNIGPDGYTVWYAPPMNPKTKQRGASKRVAQVKEGCANPRNEAVEKAQTHHFMLQLER